MQRTTTSKDGKHQYQWPDMKVGQKQHQICGNNKEFNVTATCEFDDKDFVGKMSINEDLCKPVDEKGGEDEEIDLEEISKVSGQQWKMYRLFIGECHAFSKKTPLEHRADLMVIEI